MAGGNGRLKFRLFGCGKFGWLSSEAHDRELDPKERAFMERHKAVCPECARQEDQRHMALNMLRMAALEPEIAPSFDERVLRRHKVESVRASIRYWSPAVLGGSIAAMAMLAALQLISEPSQLPVMRAAGYQSRRLSTETPLIPVLSEDILRRHLAE